MASNFSSSTRERRLTGLEAGGSGMRSKNMSILEDFSAENNSRQQTGNFFDPTKKESCLSSICGENEAQEFRGGQP